MRAHVIARLALLLVAAAALGSLLALVGVPDRESGARAVARTRQAAAVNRGGAPGNVPHVFVSVASGAPVMSVPRSFLGLSTEYWAMPLFERHISLFQRADERTRKGCSGHEQPKPSCPGPTSGTPGANVASARA
jgi:hypothetical protein